MRHAIVVCFLPVVMVRFFFSNNNYNFISALPSLSKTPQRRVSFFPYLDLYLVANTSPDSGKPA